MNENENIEKETTDSKKNGGKIFLYSFICGVVVFSLFIVYLVCSKESKIFDITVSGNKYFDDDDIIEIGGLEDNYYLNVPIFIESRLKKHPLIKDVNVSFLDGKVISIEVKENKLVGYKLNDESAFEVLKNDGEYYQLKENETYLISNVPLIEINNEDKVEKFCKKMDELDPEIIRQISEINSYPFSYDTDMFEFVMADGNYCFVSLNDINKIVDYYSVSFNIDQDVGHACIYIGDFTISAYSSTCPWQEQ